MSDQDKIEVLVQDAVSKAEVSNLFSEKRKETREQLAVLAGAIIAVSIAGFELARRTRIPVLVKEDGYLVEVSPNGDRRKVKKISSSNSIFSKRFTLK